MENAPFIELPTVYFDKREEVPLNRSSYKLQLIKNKHVLVLVYGY